MENLLKFEECDACSKKPGSPTLCIGCIKNRETIYTANKIINGTPTAEQIIAALKWVKKAELAERNIFVPKDMSEECLENKHKNCRNEFCECHCH